MTRSGQSRIRLFLGDTIRVKSPGIRRTWMVRIVGWGAKGPLVGEGERQWELPWGHIHEVRLRGGRRWHQVRWNRLGQDEIVLGWW